MLENTADISREGITINKGLHFLMVLFSKKSTEVLGAYNKFSSIDFEGLKIKGKIGIILDIDECIAPHHGEILEENLNIIKYLINAGFRIVIFSNMKKTERYEKLEKIGIEVITSKYSKPDKRGFAECLSVLGLGSDKVVMIGDNYLTDGGCKQLGIEFIKIKPIISINYRDSINRKTQLILRNLIDNVAKNIFKTLNYK